MSILRYILTIICLAITANTFSQNIPSDAVIPVEELSKYLKEDVKAEFNTKHISTSALAKYFRDKFSERYFYDWQNFKERFKIYISVYSSAEKEHVERALDHMAKYPADTKWQLPFNYKFGKPVDAYALRHLARQHKMVDIALYYHYDNKNKAYLSYFKEQLQSLNTAFHTGDYEKIEDGNGVYEAFRSGYRILNWLQIHNMFLGEADYNNTDQLTTIATLLQHGAHLYQRNQVFKSGNHQTRGLSALAMVAILLRDFKDSGQWYTHAMALLEEHLAKEINNDGFQFERTVHYHISDIGNYYYVYQLAKASNLKVSAYWESKLKSLFTTLIKIAYPDKSAPVLSDDTNIPWAEKNDISGVLTLGYLLFEDPEMGYFATDKVAPKMYWYLSESQLKLLSNIKEKKPSYTSLSFPTTGYYVLRDGYGKNDNMMMISAGLDNLKPDHQHGDILGVQAMANGNVILPNYQVRYYLKDLELFKNSLTKNVALVDDELQGKEYTSNKGGSGFGKFKQLPNPQVVSWFTDKDIDVFIGKHNGFNNINVDYSRQVVYLKKDFWVIKDNFKSKTPHTYKQVWQGHYTETHAPNLLRATFANGAGLDIYQLKKVDKVTRNGTRGKEWAIVSKNANTDFSFITLLFPFEAFDKRIDENNPNDNLKGWTITNNEVLKLSKQNTSIYFSTSNLKIDDNTIAFSSEVDVLVNLNKTNTVVRLLSENKVSGTILNNNSKKPFQLSPGNTIKLEKK
ncbi:heparinase II/III-like protein [Jejuia pallidilutea]|uniref:Heparinase II/III-like protein n=1 Tax=Jejuia pallidilutea TaxID=504487 RepID=A0A362X300_9FLAO|nr:heparinase II/III family protein [Jejuia pallidilutea]PQV48857.1 heparinase II/III-like protein [Jejuia pallidilutea]